MRGSEDLRKKLASLGHGSPPAGHAPAEKEQVRRSFQKRAASTSRATRGPAAIRYRRDLPVAGAVKPTAPVSARTGGPAVRLEEAIRGVETNSPEGKLYLIDVATAELDDEGRKTLLALQQHLSTADSLVHRRLSQLCEVERLAPDQIMLIDLETTGLANSPLFLIGTMTWQERGPLLRQYLARDYAEERAAISLFLQQLGRKRLVVSFNGKSYDWPFVRMRAIYHGIKMTVSPQHLDLLHVARRAWKRRLPDCRLATLEACVCGRMRHGDIPGSEIPEAYHAFVRTKDARQIVDVLRHNRLDLVTMAELIVKLAEEEQAW